VSPSVRAHRHPRSRPRTRTAPAGKRFGRLESDRDREFFVIDRRPRQAAQVDSRFDGIARRDTRRRSSAGNVGLEAILLQDASRDLHHVDVMRSSSRHRKPRSDAKPVRGHSAARAKTDSKTQSSIVAGCARIETQAVEAQRSRIAEGHELAGRAPVATRPSGRVVRVDDAIRDPEPVVTEDQRLLDTGRAEADFRAAKHGASSGSRASSSRGSTRWATSRAP